MSKESKQGDTNGLANRRLFLARYRLDNVLATFAVGVNDLTSAISDSCSDWLAENSSAAGVLGLRARDRPW